MDEMVLDYFQQIKKVKKIIKIYSFSVQADFKILSLQVIDYAKQMVGGVGY